MSIDGEREYPLPADAERPDPFADPPDGGYGWVCMVAVFFINGFTWGIIAVSRDTTVGLAFSN